MNTSDSHFQLVALLFQLLLDRGHLTPGQRQVGLGVGQFGLEHTVLSLDLLESFLQVVEMLLLALAQVRTSALNRKERRCLVYKWKPYAKCIGGVCLPIQLSQNRRLIGQSCYQYQREQLNFRMEI